MSCQHPKHYKKTEISCTHLAKENGEYVYTQSIKFHVSAKEAARFDEHLKNQKAAEEARDTAQNITAINIDMEKNTL